MLFDGDKKREEFRKIVIVLQRGRSPESEALLIHPGFTLVRTNSGYQD